MAIISSGAATPAGGRRQAAVPRLVDPTAGAEEKLAGATSQSPGREDSLRPRRLADYIGQNELKQVLSIAVTATRSRGEPLDHVLLHGPPGLGKTTMALVLAEELGVRCRITSAPALERPRDIIGLLVNLQAHEVLFIDEIHRLNRIAEELLYPAMEDYRLDLTVGKGTTARTRSLPIVPFTLVGATTRAGALSSPLRDRFGLIQRLEFYELADLQAIVERAAGLLQLQLDSDAALEVARRCRGTPRIANRLLRRVRDVASVQGQERISAKLVQEALSLHRVDDRGLDASDRRLLTLMLEGYGGGPVGLETLAAGLGEDPTTLETVIEPFLLQQGLLQRTSRGRLVTAAGRAHLGWLAQALGLLVSLGLLLGWVAAVPAQTTTGGALTLPQLFDQALSASRDGNFGDALPLWDQVLQRSPEDASAWSNRGNVLLALGDAEAAIAAQDRAIELDPTSPDPHLNRGTAEEALGRWSAAAADYHWVLDRDPSDASALYNLGNVAGSLGDWPAARDCFERASLARPSFAMARSSAALAAFQQGELQAAERELRNLIRRYPLFADARAGLTALLWSKGAQGEAESNWAAASGLDPRYRQEEWLQQIRRWPPVPIQALDQFLHLAS